jgi:hypothetical protein
MVLLWWSSTKRVTVESYISGIEIKRVGMCELFLQCINFYIIPELRWEGRCNCPYRCTFVTCSGTNLPFLLPLPLRIGIALWLVYRLDNRGTAIRFPTETGNLYFLYCVQAKFAPTPFSFLFSGNRRPFFRREGRRFREDCYLPPSSAEVKNQWSTTSTSPYASVASWRAVLHSAFRF